MMCFVLYVMPASETTAKKILFLSVTYYYSIQSLYFNLCFEEGCSRWRGEELTIDSLGLNS